MCARIMLLSVLVLLPMRVAAQDLDRRVPVKPGGLLQVDLDLGEEIRADRVSLEVRSHDADEVWAVADLSGLGSSTVRFRLESDDRVVRLYGRSGGIMSWLLGGPGVNVRVWVPREFSVDLRSSAGAIRIEDLRGDIRARTKDGEIEVTSVEGNVRLRTTRGAVRVSEVQGDVEVVAEGDGSFEIRWITGHVEARTESGDIEARHLDGSARLRTDGGEIAVRELRGELEAKTEGGAIYASFASAPAGLLETRRGSVVIELPNGAGAELDASVGEGRVELLDGLEVLGTRQADRIKGTLNGGGAPLRVYSARGIIRVGRR